MSREQPFEMFGVSPEELIRAVRLVCVWLSCQEDHLGDVVAAVWIRLYELQHQQDPRAPKCAPDLVAWARRHARFVHQHMRREANRHGGGRYAEFSEMARDLCEAEASERDRILELLRDRERVTELLADAEAEIVQVFLLHYCDGLPRKEVARKLDISQATVLRRLRAAIATIRRKLGEL